MPLDRDTLRSYLDQTHGVDAAGLGDDAPLFSSGRLDSFAIVDLISFIEGAAGIKMKATEVNLGNLDSVGRILAFVRSRTAG